MLHTMTLSSTTRADEDTIKSGAQLDTGVNGYCRMLRDPFEFRVTTSALDCLPTVPNPVHSRARQTRVNRAYVQMPCVDNVILLRTSRTAWEDKDVLHDQAHYVARTRSSGDMQSVYLNRIPRKAWAQGGYTCSHTVET